MVIVITGLVILVGLVVVLVALGMRAQRERDDDDDWMSDDPKPRKDGEEAGGPDRRVAGAPLSAPTAGEPGRGRAPRGKASERMADDDYWATITFDKPKFPWQNGEGGEAKAAQPDPLDSVAQPEPEPVHAAAQPQDDQYADSYAGEQYTESYGDQQYADNNQYADAQYGNAQHADGQYGNDQYGNDQYGNDQYADGYADQQYAADGYADQSQYDGQQQYADGQYADQQYADQQYGDQQYGDQQYAKDGYGDAYSDTTAYYPDQNDGYDPEPAQRPLRPDPLEPAAAPDWQNEPLTRFDQPAVRGFDKYEQQPAQPAAAAFEPPQPRVPQPDPLGLPDPFARPAAAAQARDPEATQAYPAAPLSGLGTSGGLGGGLGSGSGLGTGPLSAGPYGTPAPRTSGPLPTQGTGPLSAGGTGPLSASPSLPTPPPSRSTGPLSAGAAAASASPLGGGPLGGSSGPLTPPLGGAPSYGAPAEQPSASENTDGTRLPTVDELLQRIQADRRKSDAPGTSAPSSYSPAPALDPLNDPLNSENRDYGSAWPSSSPSGGLSSDALGGSSYGSSSGSSYGGGSTDYPTAPAYGADPSPARYDDPLGGYPSSTGGSPSYGSSSYGQGGENAGRYGDFTGSSLGGTTGEQPTTGSGGYYPGEQTPFSAPVDPSAQYPSQQYPTAQYADQPRSTEEWDEYRDYRH
ncbi:hypothetical protein [Actinocorallia sp. A-T 12471]|uniref:hypothetical protein n=1 Tax=Actinocorallia sp. A-T 12471 TaxID=3089813 RepID=UPI0029D0C8FF|nr:hypothetical protein [Actinocorallia sp. A-T 12471]MDX6739771.1 hypothetical protein [Actinocorallia sp. A-T 12471]